MLILPTNSQIPDTSFMYFLMFLRFADVSAADCEGRSVDSKEVSCRDLLLVIR